MADGGPEDGAEGAEGAEGAARGAALEQAYVHEVYEHAHAHDETAPRPDARVRAFLAGLEPGSLVCDVGCGSGQYLGVNPSVFSVGGERCARLATQAHLAGAGGVGEVLRCDNLALPFRDDAFDAVVSVAVVHHFATVERRARALRELARVTRIGGRLLLTVWAMEHEGRQFHSQDVLIPWRRKVEDAASGAPPAPAAPAPGLSRRPPHLARQHLLRPRVFLSVDNDRCAEERKCRARGGDTSPGSASLASPNETCYSFVRRALQRLTGRRSFLHSWSFTRAASAAARIECEDTRDARDLPIELRRIDDEPSLERCNAQAPAPLEPRLVTQKSRSLTDITDIELRVPVRSRSSLPGLSGESIESQAPGDAVTTAQTLPEPRTKPKLVKQKKSINEEDAEEDLDKPTDMRSLVEEMPDFKIHAYRLERKPGMFKQSSLNEELMSTERLREKERLRKNIQKQASLNEEYLYRRQGALDSLRDSIFSTSATTAKKFQSLRNGLTNKFKTSTTNIEKVTVISFVKMLQGWKSQEPMMPERPQNSDTKSSEDHGHERRHSREDGSDSSKDSSLQSDTSVDSEDSFASVIFVPKMDGSGQEPLSPTPLSPGPTSPRLKVSSVPTSPRIKTAPGLPSQRLKQFPIIRPPPSPKTTQAPVQLNKIILAQYKNHVIASSGVTAIRSHPNSPPKSESEEGPCNPPYTLAQPPATEVLDEHVFIPPIVEEDESMTEYTSEQLIAEINRDIEEIHKLTVESERLKPRVLQDVKPYPKITLQTVAELPEIPQFRPKFDMSPMDLESRAADKKRKERIRQIRELLKQGFPFPNNRSCPLVRWCAGKESGVKPQLGLVSLELFNPETDDVDSDSSGVSSPDSVDSVISVVPDELRKAAHEKDQSELSLKHEELSEEKLSSFTQNVTEAVVEVGQPLVETSERATLNSRPLEKLENVEGMGNVQGASSSSSSSNWSLNKLSPGDLRLLDTSRSHSHTSSASSGSSTSLERLSPVPGWRSKERSPKQGSTSNSTWSLNRLSPSRPDGKLVDENLTKCHRSPTRFPYDSISTSSTESEKSVSKSESFNRLQANERLVTCKSDIISKEEEQHWHEECRQHLTEFAEKLSEKLLHEIDQYSKRINDEDFDLPSSSSEVNVSLKLKREEEARHTQKILDDLSDSLQHLGDPYIHKISTDIHDLTKLSVEIQERNKYLSSVRNDSSEDINKLFPKCGIKMKGKKTSRHDVEPILAKYKESRKIVKMNNEEDVYLNNLTNLQNDTPLANETIVEETTLVEEEESVSHSLSNGNPSITVDSGAFELSQSLETGCSIESEMSIDSFCTDKRSSLRVSGQSTDSSELEKMEISPESVTSRSSVSAQLKSGFSVDSSDTSASDWSRRDKTGSTASLGCASITSLPSCSDYSKERKSSSSSIAPPFLPPSCPILSAAPAPDRPAPHTPLQSSLSDASADSLPSEGGGGAVTFHRYYHVFRQGELDQLIEKYVENLHVVSSYYDHSSWCVVAEKVQVWTI